MASTFYRKSMSNVGSEIIENEEKRTWVQAFDLGDYMTYANLI